MTPELYEQCRDAVHVIAADGLLLRGGRGCLYILDTLGYCRTATILGWWPLSWGVDLTYKLVARNRYVLARLWGKCA